MCDVIRWIVVLLWTIRSKFVELLNSAKKNDKMGDHHTNHFNYRLDSVSFNIDNGYLEGIVRGFKSGILKQSDYLNLTQCDTLEGTV